MIVISGLMAFDEAAMPHVKAAAKLVTEHSRNETGCLTYRFSLDLTDEFALSFYEEWLDMAALEKHKACPHYISFKEILTKFPPLSRDVRKYEVDDNS